MSSSKEGSPNEQKIDSNQAKALQILTENLNKISLPAVPEGHELFGVRPAHEGDPVTAVTAVGMSSFTFPAVLQFHRIDGLDNDLLEVTCMVKDTPIDEFTREVNALTRLSGSQVVHAPLVASLNMGNYGFVITELMPLAIPLSVPKEIDPEAAAEMVAQLGKSLGAMHNLGIIHGDVSMRNILLVWNQAINQTTFAWQQACFNNQAANNFAVIIDYGSSSMSGIGKDIVKFADLQAEKRKLRSSLAGILTKVFGESPEGQDKKNSLLIAFDDAYERAQFSPD